MWEGQNLSSGLGQLTDGRIGERFVIIFFHMIRRIPPYIKYYEFLGPNNFKDDYYGHERGKLRYIFTKIYIINHI